MVQSIDLLFHAPCAIEVGPLCICPLCIEALASVLRRWWVGFFTECMCPFLTQPRNTGQSLVIPMETLAHILGGIVFSSPRCGFLL